jgi:hypothetical protein
MLPCPSVSKHSPRESSEAEPRPALPVGAAYVLGKEAFLLGTFRPQPLGSHTMEEQLRLKFDAIHRAMRDEWDMPSITTSSYPRAVRTRMAPLDLDGPRIGGSPEQSGSGLVPTRRGELGEEDPSN